MIAQTQGIRTQNPVNWSGGTICFLKDGQASENSDRLDLPCLLVSRRVDCSTTDAECGCDLFINAPFMYQRFCSYPLSPATQPSSMRNATYLLWILMGMAPHKSFVVGKGSNQSERSRPSHSFISRAIVSCSFTLERQLGQLCRFRSFPLV